MADPSVGCWPLIPSCGAHYAEFVHCHDAGACVWYTMVGRACGRHVERQGIRWQLVGDVVRGGTSCKRIGMSTDTIGIRGTVFAAVRIGVFWGEPFWSRAGMGEMGRASISGVAVGG